MYAAVRRGTFWHVGILECPRMGPQISFSPKIDLSSMVILMIILIFEGLEL